MSNLYTSKYRLACEDLHDHLVCGSGMAGGRPFVRGRSLQDAIETRERGGIYSNPVMPQPFPTWQHNHDRTWLFNGKTRYLEYKNDSYQSEYRLCLELVVNLPKDQLPKTGPIAAPGEARHAEYLAKARLYQAIGNDNNMGLMNAVLKNEDHYLSYIRQMGLPYRHSVFSTIPLQHWTRRRINLLPLTVVDHEDNPDHNNLIALVPDELYPELDAFRMTPEQDVTAEMVAINLNHPLENRK